MKKILVFSIAAILILLAGYSFVPSVSATTDTYTASGTWVAPTGVTSVTVDVWAGGAGGDNGSSGGSPNGGGGGGAYSQKINISVTPGNSYTVTVGTGGTGGIVLGADPTDGGDSWFSTTGTVLAKGGVKGDPAGAGTGGASADTNGASGGSGGGGTAENGNGGAGTVGQGNNGGNAGGADGAGGGGGAGAVGANTTSDAGANGGNGTASTISGSSVTRAGGGGGGADASEAAGSGGSGGGGGGGTDSVNGTAGTANTGGGGGGAGDNADGASGGSGVVIIRFATADITIVNSTGASSSTSGSDTILTWNSSGTFEFTLTGGGSAPQDDTYFEILSSLILFQIAFALPRPRNGLI